VGGEFLFSTIVETMALKKQKKFVFEEIHKCLKTALQEPAFVGRELDMF
jgi:hypothetical protein